MASLPDKVGEICSARVTGYTEAMHAHRPDCPFCRSPWTDAMLDQFDAMAGGSSCACHPGKAVTPHPEVIDDLCCARCGRAIYLKPEAAA